jgi:transposase-like protein
MSRKGWNYRLKRVYEEASKMAQQEVQPRSCKYCGSSNVVRFGHSKQKQRLLCRDCGRTFMDSDTVAGMKTPTMQVASALSMYFGGMSLNAIRRHLDQQYNNRPSDSTIYEWIKRFTKVAIKESMSYTPKVGDVWIADETVLKIGGQKVWFWDIIDAKTRFLLASHMSTKRTTANALTLMKLAEQRAGKVPQLVFTDKLQAYTDGIELAWGADAKHIPSKGFVAPMNTNIIERFHGSLKDRTKVMRGLKRQETAEMLMDGWLVHYNFFRPHESLKDHTPAEKASIKFPLQNWLDVVNYRKASNPKAKLETQKEPPFIKGQRIPKEIKRAIGMDAAKIPKELRGKIR